MKTLEDKQRLLRYSHEISDVKFVLESLLISPGIHRTAVLELLNCYRDFCEHPGECAQKIKWRNLMHGETLEVGCKKYTQCNRRIFLLHFTYLASWSKVYVLDIYGYGGWAGSMMGAFLHCVLF